MPSATDPKGERRAVALIGKHTQVPLSSSRHTRATSLCTAGRHSDVSSLHKTGRKTDVACSDKAPALAEVRSYRPNIWMVHDMTGNVWEWTSTADAKLSEYSGETLDKRVVMGGAFNVSANLITSNSRMSLYAKSRLFNVGFRCAK